jgi:uncharacterized damage-inducible protein DinB
MDQLHPYGFLIESYDTERLKTLTVWSEFSDPDMDSRIAPYARTPREHMVHQCLSEDTWMRSMLGVQSSRPALPPEEDRLSFIRHYGDVSSERLDTIRAKRTDWWQDPVAFFDVTRTRAWVFVRRLTHSAHHRGQLTMCLRHLGKPLYSTYGPTADTGGLPAHGARTIYRYGSIGDLIDAEARGGAWPALPGPQRAPTERP